MLVAGGERFSSTTMLRSADGGETWTKPSFPEIGKGMYGLAVAPTGEVYSVGFEEKGLRSTDGGHSWTLFTLPRSEAYTALVFGRDATGWVVGGISFRTGYRIKLDQGGNTVQLDSVGYQLNDVVADKSGNIFAAGYGVVLKLDAGKQDWKILDIQGDNFTAISVDGAGNIYTCGASGSVFKTRDAGRSWQRLRGTKSIGGPHYALQDIIFTDHQHGYCVGENGLLIYTDDGGEHWMEFEKFTTAHLRSIAALNNGDLLVCGDGGALWRLRPQ